MEEIVTHIGKVARAVSTEELERSGRFRYKAVLPDGMGEPMFTNDVDKLLHIMMMYENVVVFDLKENESFRMEYLPKGEMS